MAAWLRGLFVSVVAYILLRVQNDLILISQSEAIL